MLRKILSTALIAAATVALPSVTVASTITAGGSSAIFPVLSKWAKAYELKTGNQINYQPVGSGGGIKGLSSKTFVFAASDMPLAPSKLAKRNWIQFPAIVGGIVTVVNLPGVKANTLTLNGKVLSDIYMGKITYWDNAAIKALNKGVQLPHTMIIAVHRADGSGTTFNFSNYLSKVNPVWAKEIGFNTDISWKGNGIGAKGNAGIAAQVQNIPGAIGYVEYAYALENKLAYTKMVNQSGQVVSPSSVTFAAAAKNAKWANTPGFDLVLTDQPGKASWPILATTFVLVPKTANAQVKGSLNFFSWSYRNGQTMAKALDYVPIPDSVVSLIEKQWKEDKLS